MKTCLFVQKLVVLTVRFVITVFFFAKWVSSIWVWTCNVLKMHSTMHTGSLGWKFILEGKMLQWCWIMYSKHTDRYSLTSKVGVLYSLESVIFTTEVIIGASSTWYHRITPTWSPYSSKRVLHLNSSAQFSSLKGHLSESQAKCDPSGSFLDIQNPVQALSVMSRGV